MSTTPPGRWPEPPIEETMLEGDTYIPVSELFEVRKRRFPWTDWMWRVVGVLALVAISGGVVEGCERLAGFTPVAVEDNSSSLRASREHLRTRYSEHLGRELTDDELDEILTGAGQDDAPPP